MEWLLIVVLWLLFAAGVGKYARTKGRDGTGWFVLSLLFSPLIAFIIVAVLEPLAGSGPDAAFKACPFCAETIRGEAKVCRYCGKTLSEAEASGDATPSEPPEILAWANEEKTSALGGILVGLIVIVCIAVLLALSS